MSSKILFLHENLQKGMRFHLENYMRAVNISPTDVFYASMHHYVTDFKKRRGKTKYVANPDKWKEFYEKLDWLVAKVKPKLIVVNDGITLSMFNKPSPHKDGNTSLKKCRGSVYFYKGMPVIVLDDLMQIVYQSKEKRDPTKRAPKWFKWVLAQDLKKVWRWQNDKQRRDPAFSYTVCNTVEDLRALESYAYMSFLCAEDLETSSGIITCVGFTFLRHDGGIHSFVLPFVNPFKPGNDHWENEEDAILAWTIFRKINSSRTLFKIFQNGMYDCAYLIRFRVPPTNYIIDTMHLYFSIWCETDKSLDFIASLFLDYVRYWKTENKGDGADRKKADAIPVTKEALHRYWRYCCLDCHNTLLSAIFMLRLVSKPPAKWALYNYTKLIMPIVLGPAMMLSMTGMKVNKRRQAWKKRAWEAESAKALKRVRIMCDDEEFNPNSDDQFRSLVYDVLGAKVPPKKGKRDGPEKSVNENVLKVVQGQHPLIKRYVKAVQAVKKPLNNASKYGKMYTPHGRWWYWEAPVLETLRWNGKKHQFQWGQAPLNVPKKTVRDMCVADDGYVKAELDYSKSDMYFVAYTANEKEMKRVLNSGLDAHCHHAAYFFKQPYDKILAAHEVEDDWTDHPVTGIRQNSKRIGHGGNFRMQSGYTLMMQMGFEESIATLESLGHKNVGRWPVAKIAAELEKLLRGYLEIYPGLEPWFEESTNNAVANGNRATAFGGFTRVFFGDLANDQGVQRELSAFYGQGGTAGNLNRALLRMHYHSDFYERGGVLLTQTYDSMTIEVPKNQLNLIGEVKELMEAPCEVNGKTFVVPVDCNVGLSWGKGLATKWRKGITWQELLEKEREYDMKNYPVQDWETQGAAQ